MDEAPQGLEDTPRSTEDAPLTEEENEQAKLAGVMGPTGAPKVAVRVRVTEPSAAGDTFKG